ncbi:hypothetical protein EIP86_011403 [Pleurotus ostreatoroseus]|nr:hypothetical protein EIP86_011403 [Pleurotus ostreatoroseus]
MPPSLTSSTTLKRIHREIADLKKEDLGSITLGPAGDDLFHWKAAIPGPEGSVYEGGVFNVDINLGHDYPFSAPKMVFRTRIYHMNINDRGGICIDILKHNWSPALSLFKVILSLSSLLTDPNPIPSIATQYTRNRSLHDKTAREWTKLYAQPPPPPPPAAPAVPPSARSKGKQKETVQNGGCTPATTQPQSTQEVITIDDSDDEACPVQRPVAPPRQGGVKRKREAEVIDVDGGAASGARTRRRRTEPNGEAAGEVIVIED